MIEREGDRTRAITTASATGWCSPSATRKGRATGFGARALDDRPPKYMNSPQTPLYDKSATLYGIDQAAAAIKASRHGRDRRGLHGRADGAPDRPRQRGRRVAARR